MVEGSSGVTQGAFKLLRTPQVAKCKNLVAKNQWYSDTGELAGWTIAVEWIILAEQRGG